MTCRQFRREHAAYVDKLMTSHDEKKMNAHRDRCAPCEKHDTAIRRSLILVRNLRPIETSRDFMDKLKARLALEPRDADGGWSMSIPTTPRFAAAAR